MPAAMLITSCRGQRRGEAGAASRICCGLTASTTTSTSGRRGRSAGRVPRGDAVALPQDGRARRRDRLDHAQGAEIACRGHSPPIRRLGHVAAAHEGTMCIAVGAIVVEGGLGPHSGVRLARCGAGTGAAASQRSAAPPGRSRRRAPTRPSASADPQHRRARAARSSRSAAPSQHSSTAIAAIAASTCAPKRPPAGPRPVDATPAQSPTSSRPALTSARDRDRQREARVRELRHQHEVQQLGDQPAPAAPILTGVRTFCLA